MKINNIAVIGAGTMGNGIAHVLSLINKNTFLIDVDEQRIDKALSVISKNMDRQITKGLISDDDKRNALNNIKKIVQVENIPDDMDLIIEAANEDKNIKRNIFDLVNKIVSDDTILATNTSSISITELSRGLNQEKFIGMHFMNPVPVMKLVEIIRGYSTSDETFEKIKNLVIELDKTPVEVHDYPGFISNRIIMPMINEAIFSLYEGVASAEDIDTVMKLGMNHPMGPLTLADFIGLDVCLSIMNVLYEGFNDSKYRACPLLKKMVAAGKLGRKSGEGFFKY
ncbi:MAG: 3-hydroxybutyryl-CoA dehydrogenase [Melioribacteraceae bacterium]|nr:3-hydroxybutyryl-CoA dehydrogenase [Melioribacteraceae bacterium]